MTSDRMPQPVDESWPDDVRALIFSDKDAWTAERPLAEFLARTLLKEGEVASTQLRDQVIVAALARADALASLPLRAEEKALREGVRGYLWLPVSVEANFETDGLPNTGDDIAVVSGGRKAVTRSSTMQRQCWAGLRRGRASGAEFKRSTARQYGWEERALYVDRLTSDLDAFFADEEAVEQFVVDRVPFALQHERFQEAALVTASLRARLHRVADGLRRVPPYYPQHLTPLELAARRTVADLPDEAPLRRAHDQYYSPFSDLGRTFPAMGTLAGERRAVLLGNPGSGKSTIARAGVLAALATSERAVAILVPAPAIARVLADAAGGWLATLARQALSAPLLPEPEDSDVRRLASLLRTEPHALVVIDGIDEVLDPIQVQHLDSLLAALDTLPGRVLLTSRQIGYRRRPGWRELVAAPLRDDFEQLLGDWYGTRDDPAGVRARSLYEGSEDVREVVSHPVLAGLVAGLAARPDADLETGRAGLYRQGIALLCERNWKAPHHPARGEAAVMALRDAYEDAAWYMAVGDAPTARASHWTTVTTYAELHRARVDVEALRGGDLFMAYGASAGAFEVDRPWIWLHRSFADYFTALHLAGLWERDPDKAEALLCEAVQYAPAWIEALSFFLEMAPPRVHSAALDTLWSLLEEGDPGDLILAAVADIIDTADPAYDRFMKRFAPTEWDGDDCHHELPDLTARLDGDSFGDARLGVAKTTVHSTHHAARSAAQWRFLATSKVVFAEELRALLPSDVRVLVTSDRLSADRDPALYLSRVTIESPGELRQSLGPDQIRALATARLEYLERSQRGSLSSDADFVRAIATEGNEPPGSEAIRAFQEEREELAERALLGHFGPWAALNTAGLIDSDAELAEGLVPAAQVGIVLRRLLRRSPGSDEACGAPDEATAVLAGFQLGEAADFETTAELLRVMEQVGPDAGEYVLRELALLAARLGSVASLSSPSPSHGPTFVLDRDGLVHLLSRASRVVLARFPRVDVMDVVLGLWKEGAPVTAGLLDHIALYDDTPQARERSLDVIEFALQTDPEVIARDPELKLTDPEATLALAILSRFDARLLAVPAFLVDLTHALAETGALPRIRKELLALLQAV